MTLLRYFLLISLLQSSNASGQIKLMPNEVNILSFKTIKGSNISLARDSNNAYIIYRFGKAGKIDFEFPKTKKDSWRQFKYSYYLRGGGPSNEGMDLNYISFVNNGYQYIIYDTYTASDNRYEIGIKVKDLNTKKITAIKGNFKTRKGSIIDFRDNDQLEIIDELFE